jgi:hypothetical protein
MKIGQELEIRGEFWEVIRKESDDIYILKPILYDYDSYGDKSSLLDGTSIEEEIKFTDVEYEDEDDVFSLLECPICGVVSECNDTNYLTKGCKHLITIFDEITTVKDTLIYADTPYDSPYKLNYKAVLFDNGYRKEDLEIIFFTHPLNGLSPDGESSFAVAVFKKEVE